MGPEQAVREPGWAGVLREIARGGIAGLLVGLIVGGAGGRLAMTIAALLNPDATGLTTEAGEVVGRFTLNGTLALLVFGGLGAGMAAGVVWVVIRPWLPVDPLRRRLVAMPAAVALGAPFLVESGNIDFRILGPAPIVVAILLGVVAIVGLGVAAFDDWLEHRLPRGPGWAWRYGVIVVLGAPALLLTVSGYLSADYSSHPRPFGVGVALLVAGLATAVAWAGRIRAGTPASPAAVSMVGRGGVAVAVALGVWHVTRETVTIIAF